MKYTKRNTDAIDMLSIVSEVKAPSAFFARNFRADSGLVRGRFHENGPPLPRSSRERSCRKLYGIIIERSSDICEIVIRNVISIFDTFDTSRKFNNDNQIIGVIKKSLKVSR